MSAPCVETALWPVMQHAQALRALDGLVTSLHERDPQDLQMLSPEDLAALLTRAHDAALAQLMPPRSGLEPGDDLAGVVIADAEPGARRQVHLRPPELVGGPTLGPTKQNPASRGVFALQVPRHLRLMPLIAV